ncbi:DTW domain-containing protein [Endozoicomonas sp. Mp262]
MSDIKSNYFKVSTLSNHRIRKAPSITSLSTVEAIVTFLRQTGGNDQLHQSLLDIFDQLVDKQISAMGKTIYQKNYLNKFCT